MKRLAILSVLVAAAPAAAEPTHKKIDLGEAISLATDQSFALEAPKQKIEAAEDKLVGDKTLRLPNLSVQGGAQFWNKAITFALAPPPAPEETFRSQLTASVTATVSEQVTTALLLKTLLRLDQAQIDGANAELEMKKLDVAYQVATGYLGTLQVDTLHELALTTVQQLQADLDRIKKLRDAKVLADVDVLRVEAALDAAQQQVLDAETNGENARAGLAILLGLPDNTELELAPIDMSIPEVPWTEDDAVAAAKKQRPERKVAAAGIEASDRGVDLAKGAYLPMVSAVVDYSHVEGQGPFSDKDSGFIGVNVAWNLWDWGKRKSELESAKSMARLARRGASQMDDVISFDVRAKYRTAVTKRKSLDVAQSGLKASEEAYRLQQVKIAAGAATTTDVIDAESDVSRSRAQATIAQYQYLIAWMDLVRSVGQLPDLPAAK